MPNGLRRETL